PQRVVVGADHPDPSGRRSDVTHDRARGRDEAAPVERVTVVEVDNRGCPYVAKQLAADPQRGQARQVRGDEALAGEEGVQDVDALARVRDRETVGAPRDVDARRETEAAVESEE